MAPSPDPETRPLSPGSEDRPERRPRPDQPAAFGRLEPERRAWYRDWHAALAAVHRRGHPETLEEGLALFLRDLERRGRQVFTTCRDGWYSLRGFVQWTNHRGQGRLDDLCPALLLDYLRHLLDRQLSVYYLKQIRSGLKQLLIFLYNAGWITEDLSARVRLATRLPRNPPRRVLTHPEIARILDAPQRWCDTYSGKWKNLPQWLAIRDQTILALLVATGIRACEACSLCLPDLDLHRGRAVVHSKGHHLYIRPQRVIFLDADRLSTALDAYLSVRPESDAPNLLTSASGCPLQPNTIWRIVTKYARIAELGPGGTPHCLRHTCCSHLIAAGLDPYSVQMLMGHRQVAHTLRWYTHLSPDQLRAQANAFHPLTSEDTP